MGQVLQSADFEAARSVSSAKLTELGFAPICMAPGDESEGHSHTLIEEVVIVQAGEGKIQIENDTYDLCAGSVAIVPAGQFHALCNTGSVNFEAITIYNSNVDRKQIDFKTRDEHFASGASASGADDLSAKLAVLTTTIDELKTAIRSIQK